MCLLDYWPKQHDVHSGASGQTDLQSAEHPEVYRLQWDLSDASHSFHALQVCSRLKSMISFVKTHLAIGEPWISGIDSFVVVLISEICRTNLQLNKCRSLFLIVTRRGQIVTLRLLYIQLIQKLGTEEFKPNPNSLNYSLEIKRIVSF